MTKKKKKIVNFEEHTLPQLCSLVTSLAVAFEDVSEFIENRTYALCVEGQCESALAELKRVAFFFEEMENKKEENCRDLADIYIMIGEVNQYNGHFKESIDWFKKASVVYDRYAMPYHNLAISFIEMGDSISAIKSLEQEIELEPGNYFSRLKLADLYEQQGDAAKVEECLKKLLARDPENVQALHKLISHYENSMPHVDVELMRKRLISINKNFNEIEIVIKVFHLCKGKKFGDALDFLSKMIKDHPAMTMLYLLKAHVLGQMHQFAQKRKQLVEFKKNCHGKSEYMKNKLEEFEHIFGKKQAVRLGRILIVTNPNALS